MTTIFFTQELVPNHNSAKNQVSSLIPPPPPKIATTEAATTATPKKQKHERSRARRTDLLCRKLASSVSYKDKKDSTDDGSNTNAERPGPSATTTTAAAPVKTLSDITAPEIDARIRTAQDRCFKLSKKAVAAIGSSVPGGMVALEVSALEKTTNWLRDRLALKDREIEYLIQRYPHIFGLIPERSLAPKLDWLQKRLGLNGDKLSKMVTQYPTLVNLSISKNMEPKLDWLQKRLNLNDDQLSKMVLKCPTLFYYSIPDKMEPTLLWLQDNLSLSNNGLSRVLVKFPSLFRYSVNTNLIPTFEFHEECIGTRKTQVLLTSNPRFFGASLERRLKPRLEEAMRLGFEVDSEMLKRIALYTEDRWCTYRRKRSAVLP